MDIETGIANEQPNEEIIETEPTEETVETTAEEPEAPDAAEPEASGEGSGEPEPAPQTKEERARFAAERRRREQQEAVNAAVQRAIAEERERARAENERNQLGDLYGQVSQYTGRQILTLDDKRAHDAAASAQAARLSLEKRGISAEDLQAVINAHPAVQEARRAAESSRKLGQEMAQMERQRLIDADISQIAKYDATVKSVDDLRNGEGGEEIARLVDSGRMTYLEAWKMVNFDRVQSARANAAANAARARETGKSHMTSTVTRSSGETPVSIPEETKRLFEAAGITKAEDQAKEYRKYLKQLKG